MKKVPNYTPEIINFTIKSDTVPKSLGKFKDEEDARVFMSKNLLAIQSPCIASREMDDVEIADLRKEYSEELEEVLPKLRQDHIKKEQELELAKKIEKDAKEMVSSCLNNIQQLADSVKAGKTLIDLETTNTWQVILDGKKYFFTYVNGEIKLAHIQDVPSFEMNDLISSSGKNAAFFEKLKSAEVA